jgi:nitroreductase
MKPRRDGTVAVPPGDQRPEPPENVPQHMVEGLVAAAIMAPSMHNTQPWRFHYEPASQTIELSADPARMLRFGDPDGRALHIACGAALLNLRLAAVVAGRQPLARLIPAVTERLLLATLRLGGPCRPQPDEIELRKAIPARRTNRSPFSGRPVPPGILAELADAARREGAVLHFPDHQEVRDFAAAQSGPVHYAWFEERPQLAVLSTPSSNWSDWLRAGQALQRVLLTAMLRGIAASPLTPPLETPDAWLVRDPRSGFEYPQMILRFGYGVPVPHTPRRPVSAVLDITHTLGTD